MKDWFPGVTRALSVAAALIIAAPAMAQIELGEAPVAPTDVSGLPGKGPRKLDLTGGFGVNADSREDVRQFYNAVYPSSDNVAINSSAVTASCVPGTNATAFQNAVLRRLNWLRAMAGVPANLTFDAAEGTQDQAAALMMSRNNKLQHTLISNTWSCFTVSGTNAAAHSNLALGYNGADAMTGYVWDYGPNNYEVGHRRWVLYPQSQVLATGDVPTQSPYLAANALWAWDANFGGPRPATRKPYVSWPPSGYVPYQLVYPQWSFALSNADLSTASVSMKSNGVSISVSLQPYLTGYGENTLVWVPMGLAWTNATTFPFGGTDTVYSVTVTNITITGGSKIALSYNVTLFDPQVPGTGYVATAVSGPANPFVNTPNSYTCTPSANTNVTGYQWLTTTMSPGGVADYATNGLTNFTATTSPLYSVIATPPVGSGKCFHLCHTNASSQLLQFNGTFLAASNSSLSFSNFLGWSASGESGRVQVSADGGVNWQDLLVRTGTGAQVDSSFSFQSLSLSNYNGQQILLRFNYYFGGGSYFPQTNSIIGWCLENIILTNVLKVGTSATNTTASTNFTFTPTLATTYSISAAAVLFTEFPLPYGPVKQVTAISNPSTTISLSKPVLSGKQVLMDFAVSGAASTFHLLQATNIKGTWSTNASAKLTTNVPGSSYRYTVTNNLPANFFKVQTP